jgi:hypothetical protein
MEKHMYAPIACIVFDMLKPSIAIYPNARFIPLKLSTTPRRARTLQFTAVQNQFPVQFALYIDFESFISPVNDVNNGNKSTRVTDRHLPSGFCCLRVSTYPQYNSKPYVYSGPDVMEHFFEHLEREEGDINCILDNCKLMLTLSDEEKQTFCRATTCLNCKKLFTRDNP